MNAKQATARSIEVQTRLMEESHGRTLTVLGITPEIEKAASQGLFGVKIHVRHDLYEKAIEALRGQGFFARKEMSIWAGLTGILVTWGSDPIPGPY